MASTNDLAQTLHEIYLADDVFPQDLGGDLTLDAAYDAQFELLNLRVGDGEKLAGWKVGLTAKAMQEQQGIDEPCLGHLLSSGQVTSPAEFDFEALKSPGFENELCLRIDRTLSDNPTFDEVTDAVGAVAPALEIIEKRSHFGLNFSLAIAGNAQQHAFVTGPFTPFSVDMDLAATTATVNVNDEEVEQATGAEVLGNPINSVVWLAQALARRGRAVEQGSLIMSGSFTRQYSLSPGDHVRTSFEGIGEVSARFA